jgi:hypothetical protein
MRIRRGINDAAGFKAMMVLAVALTLGACAMSDASGEATYRRQLIKDVAEVCAEPFMQSEHWRVKNDFSLHGPAQLASPDVPVVFVDDFFGQPVSHFTFDEWAWVQQVVNHNYNYPCVDDLTVLFLSKFDPPATIHVNSPYKEACLYGDDLEVAIMGCRGVAYHNRLNDAAPQAMSRVFRSAPNPSDICWDNKAKGLQQVVDACGAKDSAGKPINPSACGDQQATEVARIRATDCGL